MSEEIKNFNFSFAMAAKSREGLQEQLDGLSERIEKIIDHFTINDMPVLKFILNMSPSRDELKKLSKALDRLSDLVQLHNDIEAKLAVICHAEADPNWFALAFGDFESDLDRNLKQILEQE